MTSTFHINPLAMPRKGSSSISAQDLLKLLGPEVKNGFLRQKRISKIMRSVKWPHKFVILAHNALYIYPNEMAKAPDTSVPLLGYIGVQRETTLTCAWVFALVPGVSSLSRRSFACSSDAERRGWMGEIKQQLYIANNIKDSSLTSKLREKLKLAENLTPDEQIYLELEEPIIHPDDMMTNVTSLKDSTGYDDDGNDSSEDEDEDDIGTSSKGLDVNTNIKRRPTIERGQDKCKEEKTAEDKLLCVQNLDVDVPDGVMPPRYSAIVGNVEREYQNITEAAEKAKEFGLEMACTITDENVNRDRNRCIEMLKSTKKVGTYLIRKSRTQDYKVLSILATEDTVREFMVEEAYGLYHLQVDKSHEFPTLSSLLAYYSHHKPIPNLEAYLGWGIHECGDGDGQLYEEPSK